VPSHDPQRPIIYLTVEDIVGLHAFIVERTGTAQLGIRDENALVSATNRPRAAAYYEQADLISQAARLATGLSRAQAFVDGNTRVDIWQPTCSCASTVSSTLEGR
jgi:prophage maintenance system killer protein